MSVKDLTKLHEASDIVLHGLTADESLKHRIILKAVSEAQNVRPRVFRPMPAFCGIIAVLLLAVALLDGLKPVSPAGSVEINVFAAGDKETVSPAEPSPSVYLPFPDLIDPADVRSVELSGQGSISNQQDCTALIRILLDESQPSERNVPVSGSVLTIRTDDDAIIFTVDAPYLFGDGCWCCPGFFSRFSQLLEK